MESPASSKAFYGAISSVVIGQIFHSAGYSSTQSSALRALSDIAIQYIQSIGRLSVSLATSHNRTDSNLFDLVLSLETLHSHRGFVGGSNPVKLVLESTLLKELMAFVRVVDEVPFAKPIVRNDKRKGNTLSVSRSFTQLQKEPPFAHVPKWLPCFPDTGGGWRREEKQEPETVKTISNDLGINLIEKKSEFDFILDFREKRDKIRFSVGLRKKRKIKDLALDF